MGQFYSRFNISGLWCRLPATDSSVRSDSECASILLNQPVDILILVSSHLDLVSVASLSLTCKAAYALLAPAALTRLHPADQRILLQLIERDPNVGSRFYYCHLCTTLHPFSPWRGPKNRLCEPWECGPWRRRNIKRSRQFFDPCGSRVRFGYHHARLVMNRHFHGPACGLPLESFTVESPPEVKGHIVDLQTMTARVIDDMLFIKCRLVILAPIFGKVSSATFRNSVDHSLLRVCYHALLDELLTTSKIKQRGAFNGFVPCQGVVGSCKRCVTDFETTIKTGAYESQRSTHGWSITVVSYHLLGCCRTPWDRQFQAMYDDHDRFNRDWNEHPPGSIRQRWIDNTG